MAKEKNMIQMEFYVLKVNLLMEKDGKEKEKNIMIMEI